MKKRALVSVLAAVTSVVSMNAQVVPVASTGQHLIARFYAGISCTTAQQTGYGTAALYLPYVAGIPQAYLFAQGATTFDETTAVLTGVFGQVSITQSTNFNITNTFLSPQTVSYYYHPTVTAGSTLGWANFDAFQAGELVATYQVKEDMFSTLNGVSWGIVSGPFTYTRDFTLPDGSTANLGNFMPGGGTYATIAALGQFVTLANGQPQVVNLTTGAGPFELGSCAVMFPFSGTGFNPGNENSLLQLEGLNKPATTPGTPGIKPETPKMGPQAPPK
jgi:hypothetical protein